MRVDVAFTPRDLIEDDLGVAVVIDVIRATTSIVTLFSRGLFELYAAPSLGQGEGLARSRGFVLCGEHQGRRPEGFDFGNSPVAFQQQRFDGKSAVLCTTNGTVALHAVHRAHAVLIGSLSNLTAVARAASELSSGQRPITLVCSGSYGHFCFDDSWTAGRLAQEITVCSPTPCEFTDAARAAMALVNVEPEPSRALHSSRSARALAPLGLLADVDFAAIENRTDIIPRLIRSGEATRFPVRLTASAA